MIDPVEPTVGCLTLPGANTQNGDAVPSAAFASLLAKHLAALLGNLQVGALAEKPEAAVPAIVKPGDEGREGDAQREAEVEELVPRATSTPAAGEPPQEWLLALVGCPAAACREPEVTTAPQRLAEGGGPPADLAIGEGGTSLAKAQVGLATTALLAPQGPPEDRSRPPEVAQPPRMGHGQSARPADEGGIAVRTTPPTEQLAAGGRPDRGGEGTQTPAQNSLGTAEPGGVSSPAVSVVEARVPQGSSEKAAPARAERVTRGQPAADPAPVVSASPRPAPQAQSPAGFTYPDRERPAEEKSKDARAAGDVGLPRTPSPAVSVDDALPGRPTIATETVAETVVPAPSEPGSAEATRVTSPRLVSQGGEGEFSARLEPPALGRLDVKVAVHDGAVDVALTCDQPATAQLVEAHLPELRSALEDQGVRLASLGVEQGAPADVPSRFGERRGQQDARPQVGAAQGEEVGIRPRHEGMAAAWPPAGAVHWVDVLV